MRARHDGGGVATAPVERTVYADDGTERIDGGDSGRRAARPASAARRPRAARRRQGTGAGSAPRRPGGAAGARPGGGQGGPGGGFGGGGGFRPPMAVEVGKPTKGDITAQLNIVGNLIGAATVDVVPRTAGRLCRVNVKLGDRVGRGQPLARSRTRKSTSR